MSVRLARSAAAVLAAALPGCPMDCPPSPVPLGTEVAVKGGGAMPAPGGFVVILPAQGAVVPRNVAPLLLAADPLLPALRREDSGLWVPVERRVVRTAGAGSFVRLVPASLLADGGYRVEAPSFDGRTEALVRFTVGLAPDVTPPEAAAITSAEFSENGEGCGFAVFTIIARPAFDVGSPPEGLVHEIFLSEGPAEFEPDPAAVQVADPKSELRWTLFSGPKGQAIRSGSTLFARVRARDLADNAGAWSETWRLVAR